MDSPARHLTTRLTRMLHKEVYADVKRVGLLTAPYQGIVRHLKTDASRWADHKVAQQHIQQRFALLPGHRKPVNSLTDGPDAPEPPAASDPLVDKLKLVCAALENVGKSHQRGRSPTRDGSKSRGRSDSPRRSSSSMPDKRFKGCWHCGAEGHSRTKVRGKDKQPECPTFKALLKENDGKLPDKYAGAYEEWAKKHNISVPRLHKGLLAADPNADQGNDEHEEATLIRKMLNFACSEGSPEAQLKALDDQDGLDNSLCAPCSLDHEDEQPLMPKKPCLDSDCRDPKCTVISNVADAPTQEVADDERQIITALKDFAHKENVARQKRSQTQQRAAAKPPTSFNGKCPRIKSTGLLPPSIEATSSCPNRTLPARTTLLPCGLWPTPAPQRMLRTTPSTFPGQCFVRPRATTRG